MNHVNRACGTQYWGTSNWSAQQLTEANEIAQKLDMVGPIAEQPPYSMLNREFVESEFMPIYDKYGLGIMCYSPLAGGVLTGKYSSQARQPRPRRKTRLLPKWRRPRQRKWPRRR